MGWGGEALEHSGSAEDWAVQLNHGVQILHWMAESLCETSPSRPDSGEETALAVSSLRQSKRRGRRRGGGSHLSVLKESHVVSASVVSHLQLSISDCKGEETTNMVELQLCKGM